MTVIGKWNGHKFGVSENTIRGFYGLRINGSSDTEDKKSGSEQYVSRKNSKPIEISLSVMLSSVLGCDVRNEAMAFISDAQRGASDYFYIGNAKLTTCKLMLITADVQDVALSPKGAWVSATVALTMKQSTKGDGSVAKGSKSKSSGKKSAKGSGKKSVKKSSTTTAKATPNDKWAIWDRNSGMAKINTNKAKAEIKKLAKAAKKVLKNNQKKTAAGGTKVNMIR